MTLLTVAGIEAGRFPPHPEPRSTFFRIACHVCNPDGLGTAELRSQWDRKRGDPGLARYADLVGVRHLSQSSEVGLAPALGLQEIGEHRIGCARLAGRDALALEIVNEFHRPVAFDQYS